MSSMGLRSGMRRILPSVIIIYSGLVSSFSVATETINLSKNEASFVNKSKFLKVCQLKPISQGNDIYPNQLNAISHDYVKYIASQIGLSVADIPILSIEQGKLKLIDGECDLMANLTPNAIKGSKILQSNAYLTMPIVFVSSKEVSFTKSVSQMFSHKVTITKEFAKNNQLTSRFPDYTFTEVTNIAEGLEQVAQGKASAFAAPLMQVGHYLQHNYIPNLTINANLQEHWNLVIGINPDKKPLKSIIDKALDNISPTEKNLINDQWIKVNYQYETDYHLLFTVVIIGSLLFLGLLHRHILLSRHNQNLTKISQTDKLTGLYNRVKTDESLNYHINRYRRYDDTFSVILMDIDDFKKINDKHGHIAGDDILVKVSNKLKSCSRNTDIIGRWGGEEFLIICPKTDLEHARMITQKLLKSIQSIDIPGLDSLPQKSLSASFGIAEIAIEDTHDTLITRADFALLSAKQNGKNQFVVAKPRLADNLLVERMAN